MLEQAIAFLKSEVAPRANEIDSSPQVLGEVLTKMGELGFGALKVPDSYGGPGLAEPDFRLFQEEAARASGSFAFLQTQHQSAASMLLKSENDELKRDYLPNMVTGQKWVGIGFSQLRRPGPPMLSAEESDAGYLLTGTVPWITGYGIFQEFLVGATLPSGEAVFGIIPFTNQPGLLFSEPMKLAAMEAAQTVSAKCQAFLLPREKVAFVRSANWIANNDQINIALQGHFAIGCACAGLDVLKDNADKKPLPFLKQVYEALDREVEDCRRQINDAHAIAGKETTEERLKLRGWVIDLAVRCAHAAVASSSGAANSMSHPAQRIYREALVFTVSAQTSAVMEATLDQLVRTEYV